MLQADVVVAGGGIAGLLVAAAFSPEVSVLLLEQADSVPQNKYWLTDADCANTNPDLAVCVESRYQSLDFIAYDGLTARIGGEYCLWNTTALTEHLYATARARGVRVLMGHRLYSIATKKDRILVRANAETIESRVLVDCMGFGSPLVGAKGTARIFGYYIVHGAEVELRRPIAPVGLDNVIIDRRPTFFELFPTSNGTAHAAIILPSIHHRLDRPLKADWNFIIDRSHYRDVVARSTGRLRNSYFGIIPVGHLQTPALDRVAFFGESGQANPAASATGLTRMLRTFRPLVAALEQNLRSGKLDRRSLAQSLPETMSLMNRLFQEALFKRILTFTSDDFRQLVDEINRCPDQAVNDLVFAKLQFADKSVLPVLGQLLRRPRGLLGRAVGSALFRRLWPN
jgi:flavin-dependent dehydrogenase